MSDGAVRQPGEAVVCAFGSTEPWNAAGLGLDVRALAECGVRAVMVVAGITAQDERGVYALQPVSAQMIEAQFASLAALAIDAYRVGALLDAASVASVARALAGRPARTIYDPVLAPSGDGTFADAQTIAAIANELLERVDVLTPNALEAGALLDRPAPRSVDDMAEAARALRDRGPRAVLLKGGHLPGARVSDVFFDGALHVFEDARIGAALRGTGCLLADALAAWIARGLPPLESVARARAFVREKIAAGRVLGAMRTAY